MSCRRSHDPRDFLEALPKHLPCLNPEPISASRCANLLHQLRDIRAARILDLSDSLEEKNSKSAGSSLSLTIPSAWEDRATTGSEAALATLQAARAAPGVSARYWEP